MNLNTLINNNKNQFDKKFKELLKHNLDRSILSKAMFYGCNNGGKRIRPFLIYKMGTFLGIKPAGLNAYAGAGYVEYSISEPATNFKMDRGVFASIAGEKGFGILGSYLTFSTSYLKSKGSTNYDYTPLGKTAVTANGISFDSDLFQFGLGFKIKLFYCKTLSKQILNAVKRNAV